MVDDKKIVTNQLHIFYTQNNKFVGKPDLNNKHHGLVFRSFFYLFQLLQQRQAEENTQFVLKASFLEIYNEKVINWKMCHIQGKKITKRES
jgi:hypothetical protein